MKQMILVSHGELACGVHSAVEMMCGQREDVCSITLKDGMSTEIFRKNFEELIERIDTTQGIVLISDIQGGSPFTTSVDVLSQRGLLGCATILSGMNLSMCVTACIMKDTLDSEEFVNQVLSEAKAALSHFVVSETIEDEEM